MGCGNVKATVEVSRDEVNGEPAAGLPNLLTAMESARGNDPHAVLNACAVVEQHVEIYNNTPTGCSPLPDADDLRQCTCQLVSLLKQTQESAASIVKHAREWAALNGLNEDETPCIVCAASSAEVQAIAHATIALFKLKNYGSECKKSFEKSCGAAIALKAMDMGTSESLNSGLNCETMQSLAWMLHVFLEDEPDNIQSIIANKGNFTLLPFVEDPEKHNIPKDMQVHWCAVLEACLKHSEDITNYSDIQRALDMQGSRHSEAMQTEEVKAMSCSCSFEVDSEIGTTCPSSPTTIGQVDFDFPELTFSRQ